MFKRRLHGTLGDFIEGDALNPRGRISFCLCFLLFLLRSGSVALELPRQVRSDGLAFAVRIRRQINRIHPGRYLLQLGQHLFFTGDNHVLRFELVVGIHAQSALGQIFHVAERGLDGKSLSQIFLDGFRLRRRFDND